MEEKTRVRKLPSRVQRSSLSWVRFTVGLVVAGLLYSNVRRLQSRSLLEGLDKNVQGLSSSSSTTTTTARTAEEVAALEELPTNRHPLPPIYWINLDISEDRRQVMRDMFSRLGITDTHRVSAHDVNYTKTVWNKGNRLIFHPNISMEEKDGNPSNLKHIENIYEYPEGACLLSHLKAIRRAYLDGHDLVFILEDDALLSHNFLSQWYPYMKRAPSDWKILQFATNNKNVVKQGVNLYDYFVSWQPYHWSTRAYLINRAGMEIIMNKAYSVSPAGEDVWTIDEAPIVVADEVLYYIVGESYTSTGLWVDSSSFGSTIQSKNAHSNLTALVGDAAKNNILTSPVASTSHQRVLISESVLIMMNMRIRSLEELQKEMHWVKLDNEYVSTVHDSCVWEINLVLTQESFLPAYRNISATLPSNVHFHVSVSPDSFNKFAYLRDFIEEMSDYDLVLFKDNDQRIAGFPWKTFVSRKGNAVVAGPLRQSVEEAMLYRHSYPKRQWFQFHAAEAWTEDWNTQWSSRLFAEVVPTEVPLLEMYFVLMDGKFAGWFFDLILTPEFIQQSSAWGPDLLWCPAAREFSPERPSCHLVPVASAHEDTRQIVKENTTHKATGFNMVDKFKENPRFAKWMLAPQAWKEVIGGNLLWQIEKKCRKILRLRARSPFDLQRCARKMYHLQDLANAQQQQQQQQQQPATTQQAATRPRGTTTRASDKKDMIIKKVYGASTGVLGKPPSKEKPQLTSSQSSYVSGLFHEGLTTWNTGAKNETSQKMKTQQALESFQSRLAKLKKARQERHEMARRKAAAAGAEGDSSTKKQVSGGQTPHMQW